MPQPKRTAAKAGFPIRAASFVGLGLAVATSTVCWASIEWERLTDRVQQAEVHLVTAKKELVTAKKELADRNQRTKELHDVEVSLRAEMLQLSRLVEHQTDRQEGIGISRAMISDTFDDLKLINKNRAAARELEHFALDDLVGSIQLRGPSSDLIQIEFFGALKGDQAEASTAMLARLLGAVVPQWESAQRNTWLAKLMRIDDEVFVYKEIDGLRVDWHWRMINGVRIDVMSIESK